MVKITATYKGQKNCAIIHEPSKAQIFTDAPKDNNGKGESFSPTDLVGAALGSCMMTVMAIYADKNNIVLEGAYFDVTKSMASEPRRISALSVNIFLPKELSADVRSILEEICFNCPVKKSLHPEVSIPLNFFYTV